MENAGRIQALATELEAFEFPYCDERHETPVRTLDGAAVQGPMGPQLREQCPVAAQFNRPACAHCLDQKDHDPIRVMSYELWQVGKMDRTLSDLMLQYAKDVQRKPDLDIAIRRARKGDEDRAADVPSFEEGERAAAPFVAEHRQIVDRMRMLTAALLQAAKPFRAAAA